MYTWNLGLSVGNVDVQADPIVIPNRIFCANDGEKVFGG
jgi:hypothetical protein